MKRKKDDLKTTEAFSKNKVGAFSWELWGAVYNNDIAAVQALNPTPAAINALHPKHGFSVVGLACAVKMNGPIHDGDAPIIPTNMNPASVDSWMLKLLIDLGGDVNADYEFTGGPLHMASFANNAGLAELLIEHGADPWKRNQWKKTPRDVCGAKNGLDSDLHGWLAFAEDIYHIARTYLIQVDKAGMLTKALLELVPESATTLTVVMQAFLNYSTTDKERMQAVTNLGIVIIACNNVLDNYVGGLYKAVAEEIVDLHEVLMELTYFRGLSLYAQQKLGVICFWDAAVPSAKHHVDMGDLLQELKTLSMSLSAEQFSEFIQEFSLLWPPKIFLESIGFDQPFSLQNLAHYLRSCKEVRKIYDDAIVMPESDSDNSDDDADIESMGDSSSCEGLE